MYEYDQLFALQPRCFCREAPSEHYKRASLPPSTTNVVP